MHRRLFIASIVSVAMAATSLTVVGHAQTVAAPSTSVTSTVSQVTSTSTHAASQAATPTFVCAPEIAQICQIVFYVPCHLHPCYINTQSATATAALPAPKFVCAPNLLGDVLCTVLGLTICNPNSKIGHQCDLFGATTEATSTATATQARGLGARRAS